MHAVFRVREITKIHIDDSLYEVDLKLTADDDQELGTLTARIREEVVGTTGWDRLAKLLIKLNQLDKAEDLYNMLREHNSDSIHGASRHGQLGYIRQQQGRFKEALSFCEKDLEICEKTLPATHPSLATCYENMAGVYCDMGEYSKALSLYEKDLEICQKTLPANHPSLATCYGNMAVVYCNMGEYSKALSFCEKNLEIKQKNSS